MGCASSTSAVLGSQAAKGKTTVWDCQYCGQRFRTYEEADNHEKYQCPRRPGAPPAGVAPPAAQQQYCPPSKPQQGAVPQAGAAPVHLRCGNCGQVFGAPPGYAQCKCPSCGMINAVPVPNGPPGGAGQQGSIPQNFYNQQLGTTPASTGQPAPNATGRRKALFVGCNYPGTQAALRGCINDVNKMRQLIQQMYGFPPDCMKVLTDDNRNHGMPTRANILAGLRWLAEGAQPGDCLFFHFSGHGAQQEDPSGAEEDGYDETICPTDFNRAGMIVDDEIFDIIVAPLPSGCKLTAVMDCCHSGTGLDLPFIYERGRFIEEDNPCHSQGDVIMISGCEDSQTSSDGGGGYSAPMGAMTQALSNTLERNPMLTVAQLHQQLGQELSRGGFSQRPSITSSQNFDAQSRMFNMADGFLPNQNPQIGRQIRKKKKPKNPALLKGGLGQMLMAGMVGFMVADIAGDVATGLMMGGAPLMMEGAGAMMDVGGGVAGGMMGGGGLMGGLVGGMLGGDGGGLFGGGDDGGGFFD